jgi:hypothetical protein
VRPEQGGQSAPAGVGEPVPPGWVAQHDLDHDRDDLGQGGLDEMQRERGCLGVLPVRAGQVPGLAVEEARAKVWANTIALNRACRQGPDAYAAALQVPGQVLLKLPATGFGVRLPG